MTEKRDRHPLCGQTVILKSDDSNYNGKKYWVEDWWVNISGKSWGDCDGNIACLQYAMRPGPDDDEVVYGKIGNMGHLVHISELGDVTDDPPKYSSLNSQR